MAGSMAVQMTNSESSPKGGMNEKLYTGVGETHERNHKRNLQVKSGPCS